jgi:deoxyxylulose-5-phosphate synthase
MGGFGAAVLEAASLKGAPANKIRMIAAPDQFIEHGARDLLLDLLGMDAKGIARACRTLVENPKAAGESLLVNELVPANATTKGTTDPFANF